MLTRPICPLRISATGVPVTYARDVAAAVTLCALNFEVSIPADCNTDMIHLAIVLGGHWVVWPNEGQKQFRNKMSTTKPKRWKARNILL